MKKKSYYSVYAFFIAILLTGGYYYYLNYVPLHLFYFLGEDFFNSREKINAIESIIFFTAILILLTLFFRTIKSQKKIQIKTTNFLIVIVLAILTRIIDDPIHRYLEILGLSEFPKKIENIYTPNYPFFRLITMILLAPILEEIFFRSIIFDKFLKKNLNITVSILISSFLFSIIHIYPDGVINWTTLCFAFVFGVIAAKIYLKYGLFYVIILHVFVNLIWFLININRELYWSIINYLDFRIIYWLIISTALISIYSILKKK
jgi:membrane protease YdiL (CAAX protease family)